MATTAPRGLHASLVRRRQGSLVGLERLAREAGLHPEVVRRLVRLGLIEPRAQRNGIPLFDPGSAGLLVRAVRLRRDLGLNFPGAVLASELLARIDELELALDGKTTALSGRDEVITWTRTN